MSSASDQSYISAWRQRQRALSSTAAVWRDQRLSEVGQAVRRLAEMSGVRRVLLFGSFARGEASPGSDVDLWVEGLTEADWLDALALLRSIVRVAEVDLVRAEWAGPHIAAQVAAYGIVLHER